MTVQEKSLALLDRLIKLSAAEEGRHIRPGNFSPTSISRLSFEKNRCVRTLFPKSQCNKCILSCQENAIELHSSAIEVVGTKCTRCGSCILSCATESLTFYAFPLLPTLLQVKERLQGQTDAKRTISFACPKSSDIDQSVKTGCFGGVSEVLVYFVRLAGNFEIELKCGHCSTCSVGQGKERVKELSTRIQKLAQELTGRENVPIFIKSFVTEPESSRRRLFKSISERYLGNAEIDELKGAAPKSEKVFPMFRRELLLGCTQLLKEKYPDFSIKKEVFPLPAVIASKCSGCSICTLLCPSGTLFSTQSNGSFKLSADPLRCVNCGRCIEACPEGAMVMRRLEGTQEILFDNVRIILTQKEINPCIETESVRDIFKL